MILSTRLPIYCMIAVLAVTKLAASDETASPTLPKVVIVGDSIRLSYAATVIKQLEGKATVVSPQANGGDSCNVLKNLDRWVIREQPEVVHFNCGIHDTKKFKTNGTFQVSPEQYEQNLRAVVKRIRTETKAVVLFATTTPILDERAAATRQGRDYELLDASIRQYNVIAERVMRDLDVPVNDLNAVLSNSPLELEDLIVADGVHMQPAAQQQLGKAVATFIVQHLCNQQP